MNRTLTCRLAPLAGVLLLGAQALLAAPAAEAATVTVNATAMGRYDSSGAGFVPGFATDSRAFAASGQFFNSAPFFVFDLPATLGQVTEATLRFNVSANGVTVAPGSPSPSVRLQAFDVTTPIADLLTGRFAGSPVGQAIFRDLTSGVRFADVIIPAGAGGSIVSQVADNTLLDALNAPGRAARFAIGLSPLLELPGAFVQFGGASLVLTTAAPGGEPTVVASPHGLALLGVAVLLLFGVVRRSGGADGAAA